MDTSRGGRKAIVHIKDGDLLRAKLNFSVLNLLRLSEPPQNWFDVVNVRQVHDIPRSRRRAGGLPRPT